MNTFAEALGYLGTVFFVISWQSNRRATILLTQIVAVATFSAHLFMIQAYTGMAVILICAVRNIIFSKRGSSDWAGKNFWPWLFVILFTIATGFTWEGNESLLPLAGTIFGTYALWQVTPSRMRLFALLTIPPWVAYYHLNGSKPGIVVCILLTISILTAIVRHDLRAKTSA